MRCQKGAMWRRWDLHLHTPASFDYENKEVSNEEIIETLLENQIAAVAITDHHFIDVERIKKLCKISDGRLTVFPGIEVRTDYTGNDNIHLVGIFPEMANLNLIWTDLQSLGLHPDKVIEKGHDSVYVKFDSFCKIVNSHDGIVTIHAGHKSNSVENITNCLPHKIALKHDLLAQYDVFEMGKVLDIQEYEEKVLPHIYKRLPMIMCSDNHNIRKYSVKEWCWIKGDPTFEGLKQIKYEPEGRVRIQEDIPESKLDYLVIDRVRFNNPSSKYFANEWIELNPNLNSIIGGKSSGKSLLLYHIAKTIDPEKTEKKIKGGDKSIRYDYKFTPEIDFEVQWRDGVLYKLSDGEQGKDRPITFIPQLYLNALAEEKGEDSDFRQVIENILIDNEVYAVFLSETKNKIDENNVKLHSAVSEYLNLRKSIIEEKDNLKALGDKEAIRQAISSYKQSLKELRDESKFTDQEEADYKVLQGKKEKVLGQLRGLAKEKKLLTKIKAVVLSIADDVLNSVVKPVFSEIRREYAIDADSLSIIDEYASELKNTLTDPLTTFGTEKFARLEKIGSEIKICLESQAKVESEIKPFEAKLTNKAKFEKLSEELNKEVQKMAAIEKKELEIATLDKHRNEDEIFEIYRQLYEYYITILDELQKYSNIDAQNGIVLISEMKFNQMRFDQNFSGKISKKPSLNKQFGDIFSEDDNKFVFRTDRHVDDVRKIFDKLFKGDDAVRLNSGFYLHDVVHALMDDNFNIEYDLKQGDDRLLQMSPGKRGIILFQLFLQLSNATTPILIDQPEDNLDNRTVYRELNNFIKRKKLDRQIIIVSHNANIVVSTDSEEIIVANQHGENKEGENAEYRFEYVSGALEDKFEDMTKKGILYQKGIRNHVCEILEGGEDAFKKREQKYSIKKV